MDLDVWDPNNWDAIFADEDKHEHRIYLNDRCTEWVVVDEVDYQWALRWCWCVRRDPSGTIYARRAIGENANGMRLRTYTKYLHVEIKKRCRHRRPSPRHYIVAHRDGDSTNCRRKNLRWSTHGMNLTDRHRHARRQCVVEELLNEPDGQTA